MKYSEAVDYLTGKVVLGIKPSLERIMAVCDALGNPQKEYDTIQITGTNGKTSVAIMTSMILAESGYRVGQFISPHLESVRERISMNGKNISVDRFSSLVEELKPVITRIESEMEKELTYFEVVTAIAFQYFKSQKVDIAVLEVGMGGRWDSTNVVECDVAVITNIDIDHTNELGDSPQAIAGEKVEIVNEGCVLVTAEQRREILMMMAEKCEEVGADIKVFGRDFRIDYYVPYRVKGEIPGQLISVRGLEAREFRDIKLPMIGKHQAVNAACAIVAAQGYTEPRDRTDVEIFRKALEKSKSPGRMEVLGRKPLVLADGAHNVHAADRLAMALTGEFEYDRLVMVVSILKDKDARGILKILGAVADEVIVTENRSDRAIPAKRLSAYCRMAGVTPVVEPDFDEAIKLAYQRSGLNGMICVTGSIYTVSEARIYFKRQRASREMKQDR